MSGHSKWASIKHKKAAVDAQRGKMFSKLIREITVAVRSGGGANTEINSRLRMVLDKAKGCNMPADNIKRAIQRGTGELPGMIVEEITYEGYGPGGVAMLVETMTDNKNRTTSEMRRIFSRGGGNMGESGCVAWMFGKKGCLSIDKNEIGEDELLEMVMEAGAEDLKSESDVYEIITQPQDFEVVKDTILKKGLKLKFDEISMIPQNYIKVDASTGRTVLNLIESLEENEDVQNVYTNADIPDEVMQELR
ncbi:MAG: YebC/PmpR family DNA-binding transcriptional regulator [bacterium]|nr:YebC/PmpR family DNA-binding transcriptional regulator [bacterium]